MMHISHSLTLKLILGFKLDLYEIPLLLKSSFTSEYLSCLKCMSKNLLKLKVKLKPFNTEIKE